MDGAAPRQIETGGDGDKKPGLVSKPVDTTKVSSDGPLHTTLNVDVDFAAPEMYRLLQTCDLRPLLPSLSPLLSQGGMWANVDAAKAGDPRLPSVNNPYATDRPEERLAGGTCQTPCTPRSSVFLVQQGHCYERIPTVTKSRGTGVSREFGTLLKDLPLFQGTSAGIAPVHGHSFPWPHEDLHLLGGVDDNVEPVEPEKDYCVLPNNTMAARVTKCHNFCKELPDVMCNNCSITLYPEDDTWVPLGTVGGHLPSAWRASAPNQHVPGIKGCTERPLA